jgi:hypothetical protein
MERRKVLKKLGALDQLARPETERLARQELQSWARSALSNADAGNQPESRMTRSTWLRTWMDSPCTGVLHKGRASGDTA